MGKKKGFGKGVALTPGQLTDLNSDVRNVGCRQVARKVGVSHNYISLILKGINNPSSKLYGNMKRAVTELHEGNTEPIEELELV